MRRAGAGGSAAACSRAGVPARAHAGMVSGTEAWVAAASYALGPPRRRARRQTRTQTCMHARGRAAPTRWAGAAAVGRAITATQPSGGGGGSGADIGQAAPPLGLAPWRLAGAAEHAVSAPGTGPWVAAASYDSRSSSRARTRTRALPFVHACAHGASLARRAGAGPRELLSVNGAPES